MLVFKTPNGPNSSRRAFGSKPHCGHSSILTRVARIGLWLLKVALGRHAHHSGLWADEGQPFHNRDKVRVADNPEVISWWLESSVECGRFCGSK